MPKFKLKTVAKHTLQQRLCKWVRRYPQKLIGDYTVFVVSQLPITTNVDASLPVDMTNQIISLHAIIIDNNTAEIANRQLYQWYFDEYADTFIKLFEKTLDFYNWYSQIVVNSKKYNGFQHFVDDFKCNRVELYDVLQHFRVKDLFDSLRDTVYRVTGDIRYDDLTQSQIKYYQELTNQIDLLKDIMIKYDTYKRLYKLNEM